MLLVSEFVNEVSGNQYDEYPNAHSIWFFSWTFYFSPWSQETHSFLFDNFVIEYKSE